MNEQQVKELRNLSEGYTAGGHRNAGNKLREAADTIESLSAKLAAANAERPDRYYGGEWILCKDRLPEQPKENPIFEGKPLELYLASVKGADYAFRAFWNGKFFTDGWSKVNAVAWMPLPEPYARSAEEHDLEDYIKVFFIPGEAWYAGVINEKLDNIIIGMHHRNGGTKGEFRVKWKYKCMELRMLDDSWGMLLEMPELFELLARIGESGKMPMVKEFAEVLKGLGYQDITEYERRR